LVSLSEQNRKYAQELFDIIQAKIHEQNPDTSVLQEKINGIAIFATTEDDDMICTVIGSLCFHCVAEKAVKLHMENIMAKNVGLEIPVG
jgi:hypothetical protein